MAEKKAKTTKKTAEHAAPRKPKKRKSSAVPLVIALVIIAALFFGTALFAIHVSDLETIYPGVSFYGVDLGGMTVSQAEEALEKVGYGAEGQSVTLALPLDKTLNINVSEAVSATQPIDAAAALYGYGREGNLAQNLISYLRCRVNGYEAPLGDIQTVKADYVKGIVTAEVQKVNAELMGSGLVIGENEITAVKGAKSVILDENEIYGLIMTALERGQYGQLSYTPQNSGGDDIDLQSIYDTVYKEAKNAEYDPETLSAGEHIVGVSFDLAAAKEAWNSAGAGQRVTISLTLTQPEITQEQLAEKLFADVLGERVTTLRGSSYNRINNVQLACKAINDKVLNPGEEFSYNTALGKRTEAAGYKPAGAYNGGEVVSELGGGICQVSSALYCSALYANLQITSRTCHYFAVAYVPLGLDATVSWGGPEFKFVNNREYPVKIVAYVEGNDCVVRMLGTDVDGSYVKMTTEYWVNEDESTGARSYRWVYDAQDNLISKTKEADSRYHVHKEDEETPTPQPSPTPEASPEPTPEPTPEATAPAESAESMPTETSAA